MRAKPETPTWIAQATGATVLVHTKDDSTIEGIITMEAEDGIELKQCKMHGRGEVPIPMAGAVFILRSNVSLIQRP